MRVFQNILAFLAILSLITSCSEEEESIQIIPCINDDSYSNDHIRPSFTELHIQERHILNENDSVVLLHGMVLIDPYFLFEFENFSKTNFRSIVQEWKPNILRLPIHPELFQNNSDYLENYVDPIVSWAKEMEVYVLLGYHAHGNIVTGVSELPEWKDNPPWTGNPYNADKKLAITALKKIQGRYKNNFWVILSIFNEPAYISWSDWKTESEYLIDEIRSINPKSILMVSGTDFGYELEGALTRPIERNSIIYETHPYPWKGTSWVSTTCELSEKYPVFLGEWGYDESIGTFATPENYALPLLDHAEYNSIGWTAWIYHHQWRPALISEEGSPNELGMIIKSYLNDFWSNFSNPSEIR